MSSPDHPIWSLLRFAIFRVAAAVTSYLNASDFDHTEGKMLMEFAAIAGAYEILEKKLKPKSEEK